MALSGSGYAIRFRESRKNGRFSEQVLLEEKVQDTKDQKDVPSAKKGKRFKKWTIRSFLLLAFVAAAIFFIPKLFYYLSHESTDDAYVTGNIVPISAQVKGKVVRVHIEDNQPVEAGDPLFDIEKDDYEAKVKQASKTLSKLQAEEKQMQAFLKEGREVLQAAKANLGSAVAQENFAYKEKERYGTLAKQHMVPENQYDRMASQWKVAKARSESSRAAVSKAEAAIESLEAQLKTQVFKIGEAEAALMLAKIDLDRTTVSAPITGTLAKKNVNPGKYVQPGQPVLAIVEGDVWIVANFKETQVEKIKVGQHVDIDVDAYPKRAVKGHVDSFQPGSGAVFTLLPPENATGNFVKVVQRIPVKILIDSEPDPIHPLWPGLSVTPHVDVASKKD
jgi:membrane fusion protein (multidrug efflux system)